MLGAIQNLFLGLVEILKTVRQWKPDIRLDHLLVIYAGYTIHYDYSY